MCLNLEYQNASNPNAPRHAPSTSSIYKRRQRGRNIHAEWETTDLLGSVGTKNDGVVRADEDLVFDAHAEAMKVFGELRISWDVHAYGRTGGASEKRGAVQA
jgi:hypothetical protein